jgi:hypothetical protein
MSAGTAVYPGGSNTYVKNHAATGNLVVSFSRNPSKFAFARYVQYRKVTKDAGYYLRITAENAARAVGGNLKEFVWPDGGDAPRRNSGTELFNFLDYKTTRTAPDFTLGWKSRDQADWSIQDTETQFHVHQAMTLRGVGIGSALEATGNWDSSHILDVDDGTTDVPGNTGSWELSTSQRQDIKRSLNVANGLIHKHTLGVVQRNDLQLVINPNTAARLGESQEIIDFVKQAPDSWKMLQGELSGLNSQWGMPDKIYGIPVVVDDTVVVTTARGATTPTYTYTITDGNGFLISRPGGLVSNAATGPSFSTIMGFFYEELTVETKDDPDNRRVNGRVVDDVAWEMVAPVSGCFLRGLIE